MKNLSTSTSFYLVVPIVIVFFLILLWAEKKDKKRRTLIPLIILYSLAYLYICFFCRIPGHKHRLNMSLFHMYRSAFNGNHSSARQILFNILLFLPIGMILVSASEKIWISVLIGLTVSIFTETVQYYTKLGHADIDDLINNGIGCLLGAGMLYATSKIKFTKSRKKR